MYDVVIVGGGAAGFFTAIHIAEARPDLKILILERGKDVLTKVRISGGSRCNVTHAEFNPKELTTNYPRGEKELLGPFHQFASGDTIEFFETRGISLKIEEDGRMFPITDSSQTIIDCFLSETERLGIQVKKLVSVIAIEQKSIQNKKEWHIQAGNGIFTAKKLVMTTGSNPKMWELLRNMGHTIIEPVPSLFTFNIKDERIANIPGLSTAAEVSVLDKKIIYKNNGNRSNGNMVLFSNGPLLITHWGMSGPCILKLSAWGARLLESYDYRFKIAVNWVPDYHKNGLLSLFKEIKKVERKTILRTKVVDIPKRLWVNLVRASEIEESCTWPDVSHQQLENLAEQLTNGIFKVEGKSTFKEEFVTAGGVDLKEINFKTYESKILSGLYFAGEILNVDAITGGFNFQNAWTGGYMAANGIIDSFAEHT
ncbi:NAD(P)/FAD-dependent oxidoreductase [Maribacter sp. CXY002]|uniref:NAD(P)/FAD-dependent oxidoreductase n=1 Tax=Maribacter luteocoastalis TaxID=3407671 RepID=UPI003B66D9D7